MRRGIYYACAVALLFVGCGRKEDATSYEKPEVAVSLVHVTPEELVRSLKVQGELKPADAVTVYSKVSGKLMEYTVKTGQQVQKGDLIATVDRDQVGYKYHEAPITAPISGLVSALPVDEGGAVRADTPMAQIMNIDHVTAVFRLPEQYRSRIALGQPVHVAFDALDKQTVQAHVTNIHPLIDPQTHTFKVKARLDNREKRLIPGMYASGEIVLETFADSFLLPEEAVVPLKGEWYVYKMVEEKAVLERVSLGLRKQGRVQVLEGLSSGDEVIVGGNHKVSEGQRVRKVER